MMESSKAGYSEITRIRIKNPEYNEELPEDPTNKQYFEITDNPLIWTEMHSTFKEIFREQENLSHSPNALQDYLNSDGDTEPMIELNKRKIN